MNKLKLILVIIILAHSQLSFGQPGTPDSDFDADGKVTTDFNSQSDQGRAVAIQTDNKILVAGTSHNDTDQDFALARYHTNGSLDHSFGRNGRVVTDIQNNDYAQCMLVQDDGKILVGGYSFTTLKYHIILVRYNADGTLDNTFGNNGIVKSDFRGEDQCKALGIQPDGKILVAGNSKNTTWDFTLFRYTINGTPDLTFGLNGRVFTEIGDHESKASSLFILEDERIILAGFYNNGSDMDIALARYKANGELDLSFGKNGIVKTGVGSQDDVANSVTVQSDGKIIAAGSKGTISGRDLVIVRYHSEGIRDFAFGSKGIKTVNLCDENEICEGLVLQPDGKMLITGYAHNGLDYDIFLLRCKPDGNPDETFGDHGVVITSFGTGNDLGKDIALQADGKIVVAGYFKNGTDNDFAVARYLSGLNVGAPELPGQDMPFSLYPNPVNSSAMLEYTLLQEELLSISLFDLQGRFLQSFMVDEQKLPGSHEERLSIDPSLPPGIYYLEISNGYGKMTIQISKL